MWGNAERLTLTPYKRYALKQGEIKSLLNAIFAQNLCFKVFIGSDDDDDLKHYNQALAAVYALKDILGEDLLNSHTTYVNALGIRGFTCTFDSIKIYSNTGAIISTSQACFMLTRMCQQDLAEKGPPIDCGHLLSDLTPVLQRLHAVGHAHMDIKPQNIVYCGDAREGEATYRLIDFEGMHAPGTGNNYTATLEYLSPALFYQRAKRSYLKARDESMAAEQRRTSQYPRTATASPPDRFAEAEKSQQSLIALTKKDLENMLGNARKTISWDVFHKHYENYLNDGAGANRDGDYVYIKSDDYALAQMLWQFKCGDKYIIDALVSAEPYLSLSPAGGGRAALCRPRRAADKRTVRAAGRRRAVYTQRGRDYVRMAGRFVTVASLVA
jgi:serine/threonine protein kinase